MRKLFENGRKVAMRDNDVQKQNRREKINDFDKSK